MTSRDFIVKFDKMCLDQNKGFGGVLILCYFLDIDKTSLTGVIDKKLSFKQRLSLYSIERKIFAVGVPLPKVFGYKYFGGKKILLNSTCLIPRPETEAMCETAISIIKENKIRFDSLIDLCCGSGCISSLISSNIQSISSYTLVDIDSKAIKISRKNTFDDSRFNYIVSDMFKKVNGTFDLVFFNPPYVSEKEEMDKEVFKWENKSAIVAKDDGFYFYKVFFEEIKEFLKKEYLIFIEMSDYVFQRLQEICHLSFKYYRIIKDDEGRARILVISSNETWLKKVK
jgi:release factor glutamine methyltransferase